LSAVSNGNPFGEQADGSHPSWVRPESGLEAVAGSRHLKKPEEIEAYSVDESLSDLERVEKLIKDGTRAQSVYATRSLARLLRNLAAKDEVGEAVASSPGRRNSLATVERCARLVGVAVVRIRASTGSGETEENSSKMSRRRSTTMELGPHDSNLACALAQAIAEVLRCPRLAPVMPGAAIERLLLPNVLLFLDSDSSNLALSSAPVEEMAWMDALSACLPRLTLPCLETCILPLLITKAHANRSMVCHVEATKLLGKLVLLTEAREAQTTLITAFLGLCEDPEAEVRQSAAEQLPNFASAVGPDVAEESGLLQETLDLVNDDERVVRVAALIAALKLSDCVSPAQLSKYIFPACSKLYLGDWRAAVQDAPEIALTSVRELPMYCDKLGHLVCQERRSREALLQFYKGMAAMVPGSYGLGESSTAEEVRALCALAFPSVLRLGRGAQECALPLRFSPVMNVLFSGFCADPAPRVRLAAASVMRTVSNLVDSQDFRIHNEQNFLNLVRDANRDVRSTAGAQVGAVMPHLLGRDGEAGRDSYELFLEPVLNSCELVGLDWRTRLMYLEQFGRACETCLDPSVISDKALPALYAAIESECLPVREQSIAIAVRLITCLDWRSRTKAFDRLVRLYAHGRSSWARSLFLSSCCPALLDAFSANLFHSASFFDLSVALCRDPVPNVRLAAARLLPRLKQSIDEGKSVGAAKLKQIQGAVSALEQDRDRDVRTAVAHVADRLSKCRTLGASNGPVDGGDLWMDAAWDAQKVAKERENERGMFSPGDAKSARSKPGGLKGKSPTKSHSSSSLTAREAGSPGASSLSIRNLSLGPGDPDVPSLGSGMGGSWREPSAAQMLRSVKAAEQSPLKGNARGGFSPSADGGKLRSSSTRPFSSPARHLVPTANSKLSPSKKDAAPVASPDKKGLRRMTATGSVPSSLRP